MNAMPIYMKQFYAQLRFDFIVNDKSPSAF